MTHGGGALEDVPTTLSSIEKGEGEEEVENPFEIVTHESVEISEDDLHAYWSTDEDKAERNSEIKEEVASLEKSQEFQKLLEAEGEKIAKEYLEEVEEASARWTMPIRNWIPAMNRFAIEYEDRFDIEENKVTQNK